MGGAQGAVTVRPAVAADAPALLQVSQDAIRQSAAGHYGTGQLEAWAARRTLEGHRWLVAQTATFVAVCGVEVAGFVGVALEPVGGLVRGEVDQLFVDPRHGGRGIARRLLDAAEDAAARAGLDELVTHASWRAVPVFERLGYRRVEIETVQLDGVELTRVRMRRTLTPGR